MSTQNYRMKKIAKLISGKERVLDLGWAAIPNHFLGNPTVIGLDLVEKNCPSNYSECRVGNVMALPSLFEENSFDAIIAGELIEHLEEPIAFMRICRQLLKGNGILVVSSPNPNSFIERILTISLNRKFFYTNHHTMLYPQRWLVRMLELAGFSHVKLYSGGFPMPYIGLIPFPRPWCYQTIAIASKIEN